MDELRKNLGPILVRLMVGAVFFFEGLQKLMQPELRGVGRFEKMGFPYPEVWGPVVGTVETIAGFCILLGLFTSVAASATLAIMIGAFFTTKIPILIGQDIGPFQVRELPVYGFLSMVHEARTDWAMLLGSLFLILVGPGSWSLDRRRRGENF